MSITDQAVILQNVQIFGFILKTFNINNLITFINEYNQSDEWKKQIFPVDFISIKHAKTKEEKELLLQKLSEKNDKLIKKIGKILNGKTK